MHLYSVKKYEHVTLYIGCMAYNLASTMHSLELENNGKKFSPQVNDNHNLSNNGKRGKHFSKAMNNRDDENNENDNDNDDGDDDDDNNDDDGGMTTGNGIDYNGDGSDAMNKLSNVVGTVNNNSSGGQTLTEGVLNAEGIGEYEEVLVCALLLSE